MIFESSVQARFLIPMAISLGFGILFATVLILLIVPAIYLVIEDLRGLFIKRPQRQNTEPQKSDYGSELIQSH